MEKQVNRYMKKSDYMSRRGIKIVLFTLLALFVINVKAQERVDIVDYMYPEEYIIGDITVSGVKYLDPNAIIGLSGLRKHMMILVPGDKLTTAVQKLWDQGLFSDVKITITNIKSDTIAFNIFLSERPRISGVNYFGIKKAETDDIKDKVNLLNGSQVTEHILSTTKKLLRIILLRKDFLIPM